MSFRLYRLPFFKRKEIKPSFGSEGGFLPVPFLPFFIKYGHFNQVRLAEAHNMVYAAALLKGTGVDVPRVYCAFERNGVTYIVMKKVVEYFQESYQCDAKSSQGGRTSLRYQRWCTL